MLRYVLLRHELPPGSIRGSHWDLMLEQEGVLWTWALEKLPAAWLDQLGMPHEGASDEVAALRLGDHRLAYLDYEGPVSGDRGSVQRVAAGKLEIVRIDDQQIEVILKGDLTGNARLMGEGSNSNEWFLEVEGHSWNANLR